MQFVFVSYLREDAEKVDLLSHELRRRGVGVWLDRDELQPGQRWKAEIRSAIEKGSYFLACFSTAYKERDQNYMNEELTVAIDVLRQRGHDSSWFVPIRLDDCIIPNRLISSVESLSDLQRVDLFEDWDGGVNAIVEAIGAEAQPICPEPQLVRWGPNDDRPPGISIGSPNGEFISWAPLKREVEKRLLIQLGRHIPKHAQVELGDRFDRANWIVNICSASGKPLGRIWFGGDPQRDWSYDGLVRIGRATSDYDAEVWQIFQRYSDGTYRRLSNSPL